MQLRNTNSMHNKLKNEPHIGSHGMLDTFKKGLLSKHYLDTLFSNIPYT